MQKILIILSLSFLLVACDKVKMHMDVNASTPAQRCMSHAIPVCQKGNPEVKLHLATMKATPPNRCVSPGATVEMEIIPTPTEPATVFVVPKNISDTWLVGTNYPDAGKITIKVPNDVPKYTDHSYGFLADGKCADPRFHVE